MEKGILTVHSGGNSGPAIHSVSDDVPWIFTVAASYTDRRIVDKILLGDGSILVGNSVIAFPSSAAEMPLVYGKEVTHTCSESDATSPDVTAPGVEILAAFSPLGSPSGLSYDKRHAKYTIMSGTSMACPHVNAAATFVKSFHPNWSPSAVKSALMTTAKEMNAGLNRDAEFAYGSGHIDPLKATDPGLLYEMFLDDYRNIWCHMPTSIGTFTNGSASCPLKTSHKQLNYPSMAVQVETKSAFEITFPRTVTNVGPPRSTYTVSVTGSQDLRISVEPNTLAFTSVNEKMSFSVTVRGRIKSPFTVKSVSLIWTDSIHHVRSPLVVYTLNSTSVGEAPPTSSRFCSVTLILLVIVLLY
uniref:subtilisin-like protease SBT4.3 n=1 Tax=Erigeron canadensis TaxID=72917 RepID=UPI001CB890F5|nr:subtilisin-like protease SBT4.3 [Erigeron canadensis]